MGYQVNSLGQNLSLSGRVLKTHENNFRARELIKTKHGKSYGNGIDRKSKIV